MVRHQEQTVEPGDGARSDHVKLACYPFSGRGFDNHVLEVQIMHRAAQEFGAESARLDKRNGIAGHAGDNKAGKARPGADVDPATAARRESDQLRRIKNVTVPETIESRGRNEILPRVLARDERAKLLQTVQSFTWNICEGVVHAARFWRLAAT